MSRTIAVDEEVWLALRETPWDARALGRPTLDVTGLALAAEAGTGQARDAALFAGLEAFCADRAVALVTARIGAERRRAIGRMQAAGFRYVETVYRLGHRNLQRFAPPAGLSRAAALRPARPEDRAALIAQAAESFRYGRFAEDPAIGEEANRRRQADWMEGLLAGGARVLVADVDGAPGAFMALRVAGGTADLILAGTRPGLAVLAYPLWIGVLLALKAEGVARAETTISAANLGVVNLYGRLGFRFEEALVGLHLHR